MLNNACSTQRPRPWHLLLAFLGLLAQRVGIKGGKVLREGGKVRVTPDDACGCCGGEECSECEHCSGCAEVDRPGCPTTACCTPSSIRVVVAGVDAAMCDCFPVYDIFGMLSGNRAKLVNPPTIDGTYTLVQNPLNPCNWIFEKPVDPGPKVDIYNGTDCTGTRVGGSDEAPSILYSLTRFSDVGWRFQIFDDFGNTYLGANGAQCGDGAAASADGENDNCADIPTQANEITQCCIDENSLRSTLSTGGTATFTPCP